MPPLAISMGMSAIVVGLISSFYFYVYTIIQPFSGTICDRKGPLFSCGTGLLLMSFGIVFFALSLSPWQLGAGRFLSEISAGSTFNKILVYQANAFPKEKHAFLAGLSVAIGHLRAVFAVAPLGNVIDRWGHFWSLSTLFLYALALGIFMVLPFRNDSVAFKNSQSVDQIKLNKGEFFRSHFPGFRIIVFSSVLKILTLIWSTASAAQLALIGFWGVPWFAVSCSFYSFANDRSRSPLILQSYDIALMHDRDITRCL